MNYENILLENEGPVTVITINRPESLNALNAKTIQELSSALKELDQSPACRAVIITGSGEKSFVAGADIKEFSDFGQEKAEELARNGQNILFNTIENMKRPVIAAVNGFALGGGLELAMACHIRYASDNARLGLPEVTLGLIPGYGGTQRLPKLVGKGMANEMIFSAKMIPAQKAKEIGLVNEVFPIEDLLAKTKELAQTIARNSPMAIARAIHAVNLSDTDQGFETEIKYFGELFDLDDKKEGVSAFIEKRKPNF
ncbi:MULTISPECIES: enoyl-CoA hydratase/isomerase family protein [Chryseobacterium]|uniref:Enoyl-CoA hydratase n=1 Tax=Chryseobacterium camelliae TaxID=1265445 RepID=A0ABU0TLP2_9FLAO|nr:MULTISPECIES: enoyl-CoA hydratase-related protein [Chryseobacterium]MDT3408187.1 enoyl-CoA hydratase [Pseudacidovorax intermedius]MDQ1097959.1 enoyl-CoA hydratase [Chryseobacterium camelliae]MDQ1101890.1 enoyl-CoA hydratase [Chryseobacterium sp. SORGH_AS_1048]MDR6085330.1 enoyl-CoA hydratase [Chryseobacterium sp. SORGH_AS_0909]MDR6129688.1 enoyl-CoA hydratase [Chryseobacterium sp. SORGH_AS_1175]